ncbi:MAG TPA: hypothetical protein VHX60_18590 [Acidobacteriaceae bacterium]|jgi:hypothetical protein|nr:hypothetical protein [Acidobacteriaceae bacterium]
MDNESNSLRTGVVTRRIAVLALVALALGAGIFVLARRSVERAPTAEVSFNPDAAYHNDFTLSRADHPAVAAAQAMLSDAVVLDRLERAATAASGSFEGGPGADGDFRSRLDLEEPGLETLQIRYRDPDARRAAIVANAVATALANGAPPVQAPAGRRPKGRGGNPAATWENPFTMMRLASVPLRVLDEPAWLAAGIASAFFVAGVFGALLFRQRAMRLADGYDSAEEGRGFTLLPPMPVARLALGRAPVAVAREAAPGMVWAATMDETRRGEAGGVGRAGGVGEAAGVEGRRISLVDPQQADSGVGDDAWRGRILEGFAGTSVGRMLDAESRRAGAEPRAGRPPASAAEGEDGVRESESA